MTAATVSASAATRAFAERLSTLAVPLLRSNQDPVRHVASAFNPTWFDALPLSSEHAPTVTLIDGARFQRVPAGDPTAHAGPRTRSYENLHLHVGWIRLASTCLEHAVGRRVACAAYCSDAGDASLGPHYDDWDGVIVQMRGEKEWRVWRDPESGPDRIVTQPGDVLILRRGVVHDVSTPESSLHLAFAVTKHRYPTMTPTPAG
ncbi:cupin domain-containing protein [Streptomyces noursei]|uniref:JmjC domain-containing protein n=1 Tax=Streptomyces noursei TaxID=1971 RepID=UPI00344DD314